MHLSSKRPKLLYSDQQIVHTSDEFEYKQPASMVLTSRETRKSSLRLPCRPSDDYFAVLIPYNENLKTLLSTYTNVYHYVRPNMVFRLIYIV